MSKLRVLVLDVRSGASAAMLLGLVVQAGYDPRPLYRAAKRVGLDSFRLKLVRLQAGVRVDFEPRKPSPPRDFTAVAKLLSALPLDRRALDQALEVYRKLAAAEALAHQALPEKVFFHEVARDQAVFCVAACCQGLVELQVDELRFGDLETGAGKVKCAHGVLQVPTPATCALLEGLRWRRGKVKKELLTPVAAALLVTLGRQVEDTCCSLGHYDLPCGDLLCGQLMEVETRAVQAAPLAAKPASELILQRIGTIHTPYKENAPRQPAPGAEGDFYLELLPEFTAGLEGLEDFKYLIVLYYLHLSPQPTSLKVKPPWLASGEVGVFASRSPVRPSPLGMSVVELRRIEGNKVFTSPLDAFDGTPLVDLKPYVASIDVRSDANDGWAEGADHLELHRRGIAH